MKKGDRIQDYHGDWHTVTWMSGGVPMGKCGLGYAPIWVEKPKSWNDYTVEEKYESRIGNYEYEMGWCNDDECRLVFLEMIVKLKTNLLKYKHCR